MITFNQGRIAHKMSSIMGPEYDMFCFSGEVPTDIDALPFNMWVDTVGSPSPSGIYKQLDAVSIYNNMVCTSQIKSTGNSDDIGFDRVVFVQDSSTEGLTKASYYDISVGAYRHIPQTIDTDLIKYDLYCNTNYDNTDIRTFAHCFWPTGKTEYFKCTVPPENMTDGFFVSGDFGYEASISTINLRGHSSSNFQGDTDVYRWDPTLLEGQGDWVLHESFVLSDSQEYHTFALASEMVTTRVKITFASADAGNTRLRLIEFLGGEPTDELPVIEPITWALLVPRLPLTASYDNANPRTPLCLVTAGGPSQDVEAKMTRQTPKAGQHNSLAALSIRFTSEEY